MVLVPQGAMAYRRDVPRKAAVAEAPSPEPAPAPASAPAPEAAKKPPAGHEDPAQMEKGAQPVKRPRQWTEEEYEKMMKSANNLAMAGFVMAIAGGVAAIAGSAYAVAKRDDRMVGGIIGASGLALGLTGGLLQVWAANKRHEAEQGWTYGLAPTIDPVRGYAGLCFAAGF